MSLVSWPGPVSARYARISPLRKDESVCLQCTHPIVLGGIVYKVSRTGSGTQFFRTGPGVDINIDVC